MEQLSITLRPRKLSEVRGQPVIVKALSNQGKKNAWPRAMLFEGLTGTGKTTTAQIVAMMINCSGKKEDIDPCGKCASCRSIIEERFDGGTMMLNGQASGKDDVIDFVAMSKISSLYSKNSIFIIEEADGLSAQAKKSLLKILEDPKDNTYFLLLSMVPNGMGKAIQDRCRRFNFNPFGVKDIQLSLRESMIAKGLWESPEIPKTFYMEVIPLIAEYAQGSMRSAIQNLETCLVSELYTGKEVETTLRVLSTEKVVEVLLHALKVKKEFFLSLENLDLNEFFNLSYSILSDALVFKITGESRADYFQAQNEILSVLPNLMELIDIYNECFTEAPFIRKPYFLSRMAKYFLSKKAVRKIEE